MANEEVVSDMVVMGDEQVVDEVEMEWDGRIYSVVMV